MSLLTVIQHILGKKLRHTTMPLTKRDTSLTVYKIYAQRVGQYIGHSVLKENLEKGNPIQVKLCSGVSITLMTTRSSHICSHQ